MKEKILNDAIILGGVIIFYMKSVFRFFVCTISAFLLDYIYVCYVHKQFSNYADH